MTADRTPTGDLRERLRHALHAYDTDIDARAVDNLVPVVEAETAALRQRAEEAERQRDTAREALNAAAIVITSLRDQRDEQRQRTENAEMEGRNILRRLDIADRLAGALEDERDKARRERDEERVIRQQAEEIIAIAHDTSNQAERARQAAERALAQALNAIADERRGRLAAEAAVRRACELADRAEMTADVIDPDGTRIQFAAVAVRDLRPALAIKQPKETR